MDARPSIIPKIEKPAALANIDEILALSGGMPRQPKTEPTRAPRRGTHMVSASTLVVLTHGLSFAPCCSLITRS